MNGVLIRIVLILGLLATHCATAKTLPIDTFFKSAYLSQLQLSPDGKFIAAITSSGLENELLIVNLGSGNRTRIKVPAVIDVNWANNQRLLCTTGGRLAGGLYAVNVDGTGAKELLKPLLLQNLRPGYRATLTALMQIVSSWPEEVLVETVIFNRSNIKKHFPTDVARLNLFTGGMTPVEKNPGEVVRWLADTAGNVRAALSLKEETIEVLYRSSKAEPWQVLAKSEQHNLDILPLKFGANAEDLYVATRNGGDVLGLYEFDLKNKRVGECIWKHEQYDLYSVLFFNHKLLTVVYDADTLRMHALDADYGRVHQQVEESLPGRVNVPVSLSDDRSKLLYLSYNDRDPGSYYLVDTVKKEFGIFAKSIPWVESEDLAKVLPVKYSARDGQTIHGYLTLPNGTNGAPLPMIVIPHGGPAVRDSWGCDNEVQFLANRGYAVLQMNFRGSSGYGLKFLRAGFKEWGGKMQDDITDGVKWAIDQGIADKNRIAIFGSSYGGYAALMGLITTPDLFKCGISYAGVTDVREITRDRRLNRAERRQRERILREQIGDYRADKHQLEAISPVNLVEKIQAPVLLAYGALDPIVDVQQGRKLARELKRKDKKFELIIEDWEGHGFTSYAAKTNLFHRIELFLKANL